MLLNFRVSNFRSFKDEVSISMLSTRLDQGSGVTTRVAADGTTVDVLPVVAVLGANASGKSNLLRAMSTMREMVLTSASRPPHEYASRDHFLLDPNSAGEPTLMEINFVIDGDRYQYGFEITDGGLVIEEWLHTFPHKRTQVLFDREKGNEYQFGKNLGGQTRLISEITRPQVLFLSSAAQAGHHLLTRIYDYFYANLTLLDVPDRGQVSGSTIRRLQEKGGSAIRMLSYADLGIYDARIRKSKMSAEQRSRYRKMISEQWDETDELSAEEREEQINSIIARIEDSDPSVELMHRGTENRTYALPFEEESLGTKSWLSFISHALDAIEAGSVLLIDELDASLHPLLLAEALELFQSKKTNRNGAQLIFTTHDVTLLSKSLEDYRLSRGQIWLTEKGDDGSSSLVPLSDYRPRKGEDLARGYLQGRYGGTPRLLRNAAGRAIQVETNRGE